MVSGLYFLTLIRTLLRYLYLTHAYLNNTLQGLIMFIYNSPLYYAVLINTHFDKLQGKCIIIHHSQALIQ